MRAFRNLNGDRQTGDETRKHQHRSFSPFPAGAHAQRSVHQAGTRPPPQRGTLQSSLGNSGSTFHSGFLLLCGALAWHSRPVPLCPELLSVPGNLITTFLFHLCHLPCGHGHADKDEGFFLSLNCISDTAPSVAVSSRTN